MQFNRAVAAFAFLIASCSPASPDGATVPTGIWAGDHVVLEVSSGGAQINFDCAHGTIDESMALDASGNFDVKGSFAREGGPTLQTEPTRAARYSGRVQGSSMTLSVLLTDSKETMGTFALAQGASPRLVKCK
jgi:hypothetical protein